MPRKGQHRGKQDWLDYSDDDDDGPSSSAATTTKRGGGHKPLGSHGQRRVHGVDRAHMAGLHGDVGVDVGKGLWFDFSRARVDMPRFRHRRVRAVYTAQHARKYECV